MEGFLNFRMRPWLRRLITRSLAVVPAALTIYFAGEGSTLGLLLLSQAVLSLQLPFAIVPLIQFTNDRARMGSFANRRWVRTLAWLTASVVIVLNMLLAKEAIGHWVEVAGRWRPLVLALTIPACIGLLGLLAWIIVAPVLGRSAARPCAGGPAGPGRDHERRPDLPPHPAAAGPYGPRPARHQSRRGDGEAPRRDSFPAPCRGRSYEPDLR